MIVDSSALLAAILGEPEGERFMTAMVDAPALRMSAANWLETAMVVDSHSHASAADRFEDLTRVLRLEIVPVGPEIAQRARRAHREFGRGNHPARLNYGDCFSYALAKIQRETLLFKGNDFAQTDVEPALRG